MGRAGRTGCAGGGALGAAHGGDGQVQPAGGFGHIGDGVLAIAITLLILDVRAEQQPGESLAAALGRAGPEVGAYAASFLQTGIMWASHHALFRIVTRVDQVLLLANLRLLGFVAFLPLPTRLVAQPVSKTH